MRIALIDLGTNSVRFDVHQIGPGSRLKELHREKLMVRLGQGVFLEGKLSRDAIARTLEAFQSFKATAEELRCHRILAYGTSALREATDSESFLQLLRDETGIHVRVISGEEEARLIARGVLARDRGLPRGGKRYALIDIGGGSTEISLCRNREVLHADSFPLGTARLQQVFLKSSPPRERRGELHPVTALRRHIRATLLPKLFSEDWGKAPWVAGSSGTIRTVCKLIREARGNSNRTCNRRELARLIEQMERATPSELLALPGMDAKRVDMILGGAILFEECLEALGTQKFQTTEASLRDGLLEEAIQLVREDTESQIGFHLDDFFAKAERLGAQETHFRKVQGLAETLFDRLRRLHRLDPRWRPYLSAAAILHDVGEAISPSEHEKHSYYVVKNAHFSSLDPWEVDFVARLCLFHRSGKPNGRDLATLLENESGGRARERRDAFLKLLALLRVADALDRGHKASLQIRAVRVTDSEVRLSAKFSGPSELELLRIEQKKDLFEEVFGRSLRVVRL